MKYFFISLFFCLVVSFLIFSFVFFFFKKLMVLMILEILMLVMIFYFCGVSGYYSGSFFISFLLSIFMVLDSVFCVSCLIGSSRCGDWNLALFSNF